MNVNELSDAQLLGQLGMSTSTPEQFARVYGPAAERAGKAIGVNPQALISQWGLETGWGKSIVPGTNNLGNIKDFTGSGVAATDNMTGSRDKYRSFGSPEEFADHYAGLIQRKYKGAIGAGDDIKKFTSALVAGGYAEDPAYAEKLESIYRKNNPGIMERIASAVIPAANAANVGDLATMSDADLLVALGQGGPMPLNQENQHAMSDAELMAQLGRQGEVSDSSLVALGAGLGKGVGTVALNAQNFLGKGLGAIGLDAPGGWLSEDARKGLSKLDNEIAPYEESSPIASGVGEFAGNMAAVLPVGGVLAKGVELAAPAMGSVGATAAKLAEALRTGGMRLGGAPATGALQQAGNLALRTAGGGAAGYTSAGLVNPGDATTGGVVGAALPSALKAAGYGGRVVADLVRPFTSSGQRNIAGKALREFATDPDAAAGQLSRSAQLIPGSAPTSAMAAGDTGIASLSRAMQNADPRFAAELQSRMTSQNQARTAAAEALAGNTAKVDLAKQARDKLTAPLREYVLDSAGEVFVDPILDSLDGMIKKPDNAGKLSQQALQEIRSRIAKFSDKNGISARALYAIRKDIGDTLSGKLQGEAGNLKYASSQLIQVRNMLDDAIDKASRRASAPGTELMPYGSNVSRNAFPNSPGNAGPRPTWKEYLSTYAKESVPINQMQMLDDVLKRVQTGTVDTQGSAVLSAAKLNNILKNDLKDMSKVLSSEQLDFLRRLSADLNASQIASNAGRAVGSNTLQNMAQNNLLTSVLGKKLGGSSVAQTTLGRALQLPYGIANKRIQEQLGNALLNPGQAARLMEQPKNKALAEALMRVQIGAGRAAPVIGAQ